MYDSFNEPRPDCKPGEHLKVLPEKNYGYYRVLVVEPLPERIINFGALIPAAGIPAGQSLARVNNQTAGTVLAVINQKDGEFAKFYVDILDRFLVVISQPENDPKYGTKAAQFFLNQNTPLHQRIFWQFEDDSLGITIWNPLAAAIAAATPLRIRIWGYKYKLEKLQMAPAMSTTVTCGSMSNVTGGI